MVNVHDAKVSNQRFYYNVYFWLDTYRSEIKGEVLEVGPGKGYAAYILAKEFPDAAITAIDVVDLLDDTLDGFKFQLYDGVTIPFPDNYFETVVCFLTLHHAKNQLGLLSEMMRVCRGKVVILEQTYNDAFGRIELIGRCWLANKRSHQKVYIEPRHYLSVDRFRQVFENLHLQEVYYERRPNRHYFSDLFILTGSSGK